jgi:hypothetical protein
MLTFELVSKKRRPIKRYAFSGIIIGILIFILIGFTGHLIANTVKVALMLLIASTFVICLYIINYSVKFKNAIGQITFSKNYVEIEMLQKKETLLIEDIGNIRFELVGFDGLNKKRIILGIYDLTYNSGINNFVYIQTNSENKKYEFYVPNQNNWADLQRLVSYYKETLSNRKNKT